MSELHPIDFGSLKKDSTIDQAQIEQIYNIRKQHAPEAFRLCQLRLKQDIERRRSDLLCRIHHDGIRIMTDSEGNVHTFQEYRRGVRKIAKQARRRAAIVTANLPEEERRRSELLDAHITAEAIMNRRALARAQREILLGSGFGQQPLLVAGSDEEGDDS